MPGARARSLLLRLSTLAASLLAASLLFAVNAAHGSEVPGSAALLAPPPSTPGGTGTTPNPSPFPPTAPTGLQVTDVKAASVTLTWTASAPGCCAVAGYDITYTQAFNDVVWSQSVGNVTTITVTANIRPATQYNFRVAARDDVGHRSAASNSVTVVTPLSDGGPDPVPPSAPANLQAGPAATVTWSPSTDNVAVTGYLVYRFDGLFVSTLLATVTGTTYLVPVSTPRDLIYVRARDAAGNVSIASNIVTVSAPTTPPATLSCRAAYATSAQWAHGFVAGVTITNTGAAAINGWTLSFTFGGDQRITDAWNAAFSQSGAAVAMRNAAWNGVIPPGASVRVGMQGTWSSSVAPPTALLVNGVACAVGA